MNRFAFLEQDYPELYQRCSEAMEYGLQDFSIAMLKSRQALEKIVEHFDAEGENLFTKINALGDSGEIPKSVMKHFHTVRQVANPSVHGQEVSESEIIDALDALFEITVWLAVRKEGHRYEAELFNDRDYFIVRRYETQTGKEDSTVSGGTPSGRTQEIDFEKILEQYKQAAEAGDSDAMFNVGEMYAIGKGIVQDYDEAMQWYQKAADEGNTAAMIAMGKLYAEGKGAQQNFGKAMEWYQKAADADNQDAAALLGECYEKGEGIVQDYAESMRRYQAAAEKGSTVAMRNLSRFFAEGNGIAKDEKTALKWLQRAANQGDTESMKILAYKHLLGEWGLFKNPDEGLNWLRKASDAGDTDATLKIGCLYADGGKMGIPLDGEEASKWLEKAAKAGSTEGMRRLGDLYLPNETTFNWMNTVNIDRYLRERLYEDVFESCLDKENLDYVIKWYRKAASLGDTEAMIRLGIVYILGISSIADIIEGLKCLQKAAELGNIDAMYCLGEMYYNGNAVHLDIDAGLNWFRKATDSENMDVISVFNSISNVVQLDKDIWVNWFKHAADTENCDAMLALGIIYMTDSIEKIDRIDEIQYLKIGSWGYPSRKNAAEAMKWYCKAADAGSDVAMNLIGLMYFHGTGIKKDSTMAIEWFQKAADKGNHWAMYNLGKMYYDFLGGRDKAKEWFQKASHAGDEKAQKILKNFDKGVCFITTAVCGSLQKPDDCYELTSFRAFRDGWLSAQPDGAALIDEYYAVAPPIVQAIDALPDAKEIYRGIWDKYLAPCLVMLEAKNMRGCKETYVKMVRDLQARFG